MQHRHFTHIVPSGLAGRPRLSRYAIGVFPFLETGSSVKKAIKKREVFINNRVGESGDWVAVGDVLEYRSSFVRPANVDPMINVVYKDEHLLVINKPPGLLSSGESSKSLQNILKSYPSSDNAGALFYPYLIHRLDRQTSGLIIAARTIEARRLLGEMVQSHGITKGYSMIVQGHVADKLKWITERVEGKEAKTEVLSVHQLTTRDAASYIRVKLHTGRTHQIRRHFQSVGHPLVGDDIYNADGLSFGRGLFLMADYLSFNHPITNINIDMNCKLHNKFLKFTIDLNED